MTDPDRASQPDPKLETRCSTAVAGRCLGITPRAVVNMIQVGTLVGWDMRADGAKRPHYTVSMSSIRELLLRRQVFKRTDGMDVRATSAKSSKPPRGGGSSRHG